MACINVNLEEYKTLTKAFGANLKTYVLTQRWQELNSTEKIPSIKDLKTMMRDNKVTAKKNKSRLQKDVINNLLKLDFIQNINDIYYRLNITPQSDINNLITKINNYLIINNIPTEFVDIKKLGGEYKISFNPNVINNSDVILKTKNFNVSKTSKILDHLLSLFPQMSYMMTNSLEAKKLYDRLPMNIKAQNVEFDDIKSFFDPINKKIVIIEERVTDEIAIEEVLHPFISALRLDNETLFNNLLKESVDNFPQLNTEIEEAYADKRGFTQEDRDEELVTKALTRYFKKEYETEPTKSFKSRVQELLTWFLEMISNFHKYITGKTLEVEPSDISKNATLSDVAKLLNTSDVILNLNYKRIPNKVKYALSKGKKEFFERLNKKASPAQKEAMAKLFKGVINYGQKDFDVMIGSDINNPGVVIDFITEDGRHDYIDIASVKEDKYTSATEAVSGKYKGANTEYNLQIGNVFDTILEGQAMGKTSEQIIKDLGDLITYLIEDKTQAEIKALKEKNKKEYEEEIEKAKKSVIAIQEVFYSEIRNLENEGAIVIPQVVVFDVDSKIAGTIDVLIITTEGEMKILDLKTSKYSVKNDNYNATTFPHNILDKDSSLLRQKSEEQGNEITALSTKGKQGLQVNLYALMLENMGFTVLADDSSRTSLHYLLKIEGKGDEQKFKGYGYDAVIQHTPSTNLDKVQVLVKRKQAAAERNEILDAQTNKKTIEEDYSEEADSLSQIDAVTTGLKNYRDSLMTRKQAIEKMNNNIFLGTSRNFDKKTKELIHLEYIDKTIAWLTVVLESGNKKDAKDFLTKAVRDSIKQAREFSSYLSDPQNALKDEYITFALNAKKFAQQFEGLISFEKSVVLPGGIKSLLHTLQSILTEIDSNYKDKLSLANQAIIDFTKMQIRNNTSQEFEDAELDALLSESTDIGMYEYWTRDLATSRDVILRVMNKIYHNKKMEVFEKVQAREGVIRKAANKLLRLSGLKDPEKAYTYMLNKDGTYIKKHGGYYNEQLQERLNAIRDDNGNPLTYRETGEPGSKNYNRDIAFNIDLAKKKGKYSEFWNPEQIVEGQPVDGLFHRYNQEFIDARKKYQIWTSDKFGTGKWERNSENVTEGEYKMFKLKYYDAEKEYIGVKYENGEPTGETVTRRSSFVKRKYREIRDAMPDGKSLLNERYVELMNPTTELGKAQKEFYEMYVGVWEELLNKLPPGIRSKMLGRIPLVRNHFFTELDKKHSWVKRLWIKLKSYLKRFGSFLANTSQQRTVVLDEFGNPVDSVPIYYVGDIKNEERLKEIELEIDNLKILRSNDEISRREYDKKLSFLNGEIKQIESKPSSNEISKDLGSSLLKFSLMAEHYEVMNAAEDIFNSFMHTIESKTFQSSPSILEGVYKEGNFIKKGSVEGKDSRVYDRAQKFLDMVFYDKKEVNKATFDKVGDGFIKLASLSYIAASPVTSLNNYMFGRLGNLVEAVGERYFSKASYGRAELEFQKFGFSSIIERLSAATKSKSGKGFYDLEKPNTKWEAFVDYFKMMDDKGDLRESGFELGKKSFWGKANNILYSMQDMGEFNVQTKVGISLLMDTIIKNSKTGDTLSLYDAYIFDSVKKELVLKDGYDTIITKKKDRQGNVITEQFNNEFRYNLRSEIREVNKQIHGNYAKDDRTVMEYNVWGRLVMQFHKWVAPALNARMQSEYYDENLGWVEGRYRSFYRVATHMIKEAGQGNLDIKKFKDNFLKSEGADYEGKISDQKAFSEKDQAALNVWLNFNRSMGELAIIGFLFLAGNLLKSMADDDDDETVGIYSPYKTYKPEESNVSKRMFNWARWQTDRLTKEFIAFVPVFPGSIKQSVAMVQSPIASANFAGELGEALSYSFWTPLVYLTQSDEDFKVNKEYVYQRGVRKGELKLNKNWSDVLPILRTYNKWVGFNNLTNYHIK